MRGKDESAVKREIREYLKKRGVFHVNIVQGPRSPRGVSDLLCVVRVRVKDLVEAGIETVGMFAAIEVKREVGGITSDHQKKFIADVKEHGGFGVVVNSVEELKRAFGWQDGAGGAIRSLPCPSAWVKTPSC